MRTRMAWGWIAAAGAGLVCGGCGFKGPLYLPERNATVVTHPPQSAQGAPPAGKNKTKNSPPSSSPQASPPQSPQPPAPPPQ